MIEHQPRPTTHSPFLADVTAFLPNTQASPKFLICFLAEEEHFLHKMLKLGGGLHADVGLSHVCETDDTLIADQVVQCMRLIFSEQSRVWRRRRQACTCATYMEAELFVDGRLYVCHRNPFHYHRLVREDCKKTSQPSFERCTNIVKFPLLWFWPQERG